MKTLAYPVLASAALFSSPIVYAQESSGDRPYPFTSSYFVGEWVDSEDCSLERLTMSADGTFTAPGGGTSTWSLDGNILTFGSGASASSFMVEPVSRGKVIIYNEDGTVGYSIRC